VTISGPEPFFLGSDTGHSNSSDGVVTDIAATAASPTTIHSSLTLIDASATTGGVTILAGATNTTGAGKFENGGSLPANVVITYTGLTIKGGSGNDLIENDAKNGIVTDGSGKDVIILGGAGEKATLGTHSGDRVAVGLSNIGTNEVAGSAIGDKVTFGAASTAELFVYPGAKAGLTDHPRAGRGGGPNLRIQLRRGIPGRGAAARCGRVRHLALASVYVAKFV
jgi:hypothetical protein